jgi:hypothetical protein
MPIVDVDRKTQRHACGSTIEFGVECDCVSQHDWCPSLRFTFFDADDDRDLLYVYASPGDGIGWRQFWRRLKFAWSYIAKGHAPWPDEIVLERPSVTGLARRLMGVQIKMDGPKETPEETA